MTYGGKAGLSAPTVSSPELTSGRAARLQSAAGVVAAVEPAALSSSPPQAASAKRQGDGQQHGEQEADAGTGHSGLPAGRSATAAAYPAAPGMG